MKSGYAPRSAGSYCPVVVMEGGKQARMAEQCEKQENNSFQYRGMRISIVYEDNHLLSAVKHPGILSQEDDTADADMLTILKQYLKEKYHKPGNVYLGLVHRLDRPVGGVMVFGKTSKAAGRLSEQIRARQFHKTYCAVVYGRLQQPEGRLEHDIFKDSRSNRVRVEDVKTTAEAGIQNGNSAADGPGFSAGSGTGTREGAGTAAGIAKNRAILDYQELAYRREENASLIRINLITGRPHQIRAQFAHIGHPVVGDRKYGREQASGSAWTAGVSWPALWAYAIELKHPVSGDPLRLEAAWPHAASPWALFNDLNLK